ncbi:MAG: FlgD immunoglobulin-like domain containing protein, partial [Rhodothermales bacterium]
SVPSDLSAKAARTVFEDDLGAYDSADWRLFALKTGSRLVELTEEEPEIVPGKAFWMLAHGENRVCNTGSGASIGTSETFSIRLNQEWNLIGNPFAFDIPVSNLHTASGAGIGLWRYDGSWKMEEEVIHPFEGYALFSHGVDTLWIDPDLSPDNVASNAERNARNTEARATNAERVAQLEALFSTTQGDASVVSPGLLRFSAYPNPFTGSTTLSFELVGDGRVSIRVFDLLGRVVVRLAEAEEYRTGLHSVVWDGQDGNGSALPAGLYVVRVEAEAGAASIAVSLVR